MSDFKVIAHIRNNFNEKFGIPRQSGIASEEISTIIFEPEYRDENALRGLEGFSHIWLIWLFSENKDKKWSATVRPPRLGGNKRVGVFATRSPYRPNPIGLSSVKLLEIKKTAESGTVLVVSGADLMNGTPILDIKPYLSYSDCHADAEGSYTENNSGVCLNVEFTCECDGLITDSTKQAITDILSRDPRPAYQHSNDRVYKISYANYNIGFTVNEGTVYVKSIEKL